MERERYWETVGNIERRRESDGAFERERETETGGVGALRERGTEREKKGERFPADGLQDTG